MNVSVSRSRAGRVACYTIPHRHLAAVAAGEGLGLRVAVRAQEAQILQAVVGRITVGVINLKYKGLSVPLGRLTTEAAEVRESTQLEDVFLQPLTVDPVRSLHEYPLDRCGPDQCRIGPAVAAGKVNPELFSCRQQARDGITCQAQVCCDLLEGPGSYGRRRQFVLVPKIRLSRLRPRAGAAVPVLGWQDQAALSRDLVEAPVVPSDRGNTERPKKIRPRSRHIEMLANGVTCDDWFPWHSQILAIEPVDVPATRRNKPCWDAYAPPGIGTGDASRTRKPRVLSSGGLPDCRHSRVRRPGLEPDSPE